MNHLILFNQFAHPFKYPAMDWRHSNLIIQALRVFWKTFTFLTLFLFYE